MPDGSWRYGDAGDRFPIKPGEVWASGVHILACADLELGAVDEFLDRFCPCCPDCTYTDPPWNAGNASSFRTKAGVPAKVDFGAFLDRVIAVIARTKGLFWIETGFKDESKLTGALTRGFDEPIKVRRFEVTYYRKHPSLLYACARESSGLVLDELPNVNGLDDDFTPNLAIQASTGPGDVVFDPCTGRGLTCRTAHELGRRFVGTELHPRRLACVLAWLKDEHCHSPSKVGELETMKGANGA